MKKCLTDTAIKGTFRQNEKHSDIYDLQTIDGVQFPFTYFRLSSPRNEFLIKQRAVYVAESHRNGVKILFTGLRPANVNTFYSGNMFNQLTKKRSLIIFRYNLLKKSFKVYLYPYRNPKKLQPIINEILAL